MLEQIKTIVIAVLLSSILAFAVGTHYGASHAKVVTVTAPAAVAK